MKYGVSPEDPAWFQALIIEALLAPGLHLGVLVEHMLDCAVCAFLFPADSEKIECVLSFGHMVAAEPKCMYTEYVC